MEGSETYERWEGDDDEHRDGHDPRPWRLPKHTRTHRRASAYLLGEHSARRTLGQQSVAPASMGPAAGESYVLDRTAVGGYGGDDLGVVRRENGREGDREREGEPPS